MKGLFSFHQEKWIPGPWTMTCVVISCILKYIFSDLHLISLQLLCKPVKFTSETDSTQSCSDSALSLCRRILPGDRSWGTQWMIHCASDCLESAQHSQPTLTFAVVDINFDVAESSMHTVHISAQRCWGNLKFLLTTTFQAVMTPT